MQTCTSSVASPKFSLDDDGVRRDFRFDLPAALPPLLRLPKLPLLTASSSGVPGALSSCSRLKKAHTCKSENMCNLCLIVNSQLLSTIFEKL